MEELKKNKRESFDDICCIVKALALFFCFYPLFDRFFSFSAINAANFINPETFVTTFLLLVAVLAIWLVLQPRRTKIIWRRWLEMGVFYAVCLASVVTSGGATSNYKFLFLFVVIAYSVQYGILYGMTIAIVSAVTILGIDLFSAADVHRQFQSDIALSVMFAITALLLGRYVEMEVSHIRDLTEIANRDSLTNLYNHRYFHESLSKAWEKIRTDGGDLSMLIMDIDYFKVYNDARGHMEGDKALRQVSQLIETSVGEGAICCRYGGEKFSVILPGRSNAASVELANRVRLAVMDAPVEGEEILPDHKLTISMGVASCSPSDEHYYDVITRADAALYRAKYLRKNRVEAYQDILDRCDAINESTRNSLLSIRGLVGIINSRDDYTYNHTERVVYCCDMYADYVHMSDEDRRTLILSAYMHDIGKINVPRETLISNERFTNEQWAMIRRHPADGEDILEQITGMELVSKIVGQHHERYDGSGYPRGLAGNEIHPLASILALADSFDAMTNNRPYQNRRSYADAMQEIRRCSGKHFNPAFVDTFIAALTNEISPAMMR